MKENNKIKNRSIFSCYSYNLDLEKFFLYFTNQLYFMSKNKALFSVQGMQNPILNFDTQYFVKFNFYPYYNIIICDKIVENSSFIKRVNRIYHVQNNKNLVSYQIIYTFYDNTCENKINAQLETTLLSTVSPNAIQLYNEFIAITKNVFTNSLKNFCNKKMNEISYINESIIIYCSQQQIYNYINNIENILKLYYYNYKWIRLNENTIEVINDETKINTIYSIYKIKKLNNECINVEIQKKLIKNNEINSSYITHFKINPLSNNICWFCCDFPIPFGSSKSAIKNMTSVCKFLIKKIKQSLENNM